MKVVIKLKKEKAKVTFQLKIQVYSKKSKKLLIMKLKS